MPDRKEDSDESGRSDKEPDDLELVEIRKGEDSPEKTG